MAIIVHLNGGFEMERENMLDFLKRIADGIAVMFGNNCEVVIHDMENDESSILYITNNHVTEREKGDKLDFLGIGEINELFKGTDLVNIKGVANNNHLLKCSTFHAKGEDYHFALGINYDYTNLLMMENVLKDLTYVGESVNIVTTEKDENLEQKLDDFYSKAVDYVGKPIPFMRKKDRVKMIHFLYNKGAFSIHKSIPIIAEKMKVSRYTIYNYLKEIKEQTQQI